MVGNDQEDAVSEKLGSSAVVSVCILESVDGLSSNIRGKSGGGFVMQWL